jgi:conjugal transfer ATP-binding protein TraC
VIPTPPLPGSRVDPEIGPLEIKPLTRDLSPWQVERGALLLAGGSYVIGFACSPAPTETLSTGALAELSRRAQALLAALPEGESVRVARLIEPGEPEQVRDHAARTASLEGVLKALRDARLSMLRGAARSGALLTHKLYVFVSYHPPRLRPPSRLLLSLIGATLSGIAAAAVFGRAGGLGAALAVGGALWLLLPRAPGPFAPRHRAHVEDDHRFLKGLRGLVTAYLRGMGLSPRPLLPEEYLEIPWRYMNPGLSSGGVRPPRLPGTPYETVRGDASDPSLAPVTMRELIAGSDMDRDFRFIRKDGMHIAVVSMETLPIGTTVMGHLGGILGSRMPMWAICDIDKPPAASTINRLAARAALLGGIRESRATEAATLSATVTHESLREILLQVFAGRTRVYSLGLGFVLARRTPEDLDRAVLRVHQEASQANGMTVVQETLALSPQVRRLMPCSGQLNRRMRTVLAQNAAHLMPLGGPWAGSPRAEAVFHNRWGGVTAIDIFDDRASSWNGVVSGATGSGKSAFACQLILQSLRPGIRVVIIDKGVNTPPSSYLTLTRVLGGSEIVFGAGEGPSINPFDCDEDMLRYFRGEDVPPSVVEDASAKLDFLVKLVGKLVGRLTELEEGLVGEAILQTYRRPRPPGEPVLMRDLVRTMRSIGDIQGHAPTQEQRDALLALATRLWQWVERGRYAQLLDRPTNVSLSSQVTYVDLGGVSEESALMPVIVLLLTDFLYQHARRTVGRERLLVVNDEVWAILRDPQAAVLINDMYRRFRHFGASVLSVSQDIRDFDTPQARAILGNATWWFLLRPTDRESVVRLAGLNDIEARALGSLSGRAGEYSEILAVARFGDHSESGIIEAIPTSLEFWISASGAAEKAMRQEAVARCGGDVWAAIQELARLHPRGGDILLGGAEGGRETSSTPD